MSYWNEINNNECNHSHSCYDGKCVSEKELVNAKDDIIETTKEYADNYTVEQAKTYAEGLQTAYEQTMNDRATTFESGVDARVTAVEGIADTANTNANNAVVNATSAVSNANTANTIANEAKTTADINNARLDTAIEAVTTDTEVTDIRVGADGVTYDTAGNAVRGQYNTLFNLLSKTENVDFTAANAYFTTTDKTIKGHSDRRIVWAECTPYAKYTVTKTAGKVFRVGFGTAHSIDTVLTGVVADDTGDIIEATAPEGVNYIVAYVWNGVSGGDTITADEMLESVNISKYSLTDINNMQNDINELDIRITTLENTETQLNYYAIGDSITRGMYANIGAQSSSGQTNQNYPYWIAKTNNFNLTNLGVSGSGYANKGGNTPDESGTTNIKNIVDDNEFSDADIITIAYGINDYKGNTQNISLGNMTSVSGDGTVVGNMKYAIETLNTKCPTAQIIVLLPMNQNRYGDGDFESNYSFGYAFRENKTLVDYRNAIRDCAEYYNLKVVDQEEICPINRLNIRYMLGDGLHPTREYHKQMGLALANYIH